MYSSIMLPLSWNVFFRNVTTFAYEFRRHGHIIGLVHVFFRYVTSFVKRIPLLRGTPVAQSVKRWPVELVVLSSSAFEAKPSQP